MIIANRDKYEILHMDRKSISYTTIGKEKQAEQQFVFFTYRILIDSDFIVSLQNEAAHKES